eukprot:1150739-Pelagomonas_calceolata.AAC.4
MHKFCSKTLSVVECASSDKLRASPDQSCRKFCSKRLSGVECASSGEVAPEPPAIQHSDTRAALVNSGRGQGTINFSGFLRLHTPCKQAMASATLPIGTQSSVCNTTYVSATNPGSVFLDVYQPATLATQ